MTTPDNNLSTTFNVRAKGEREKERRERERKREKRERNKLWIPHK